MPFETVKSEFKLGELPDIVVEMLKVMMSREDADCMLAYHLDNEDGSHSSVTAYRGDIVNLALAIAASGVEGCEDDLMFSQAIAGALSKLKKEGGEEN